jgi:nucleoside-diphosphate-sugar epimerase
LSTVPHLDTVALTGATGWLGNRVIEMLLEENDDEANRRFTLDRVVCFARDEGRLPAIAAKDPRVAVVKGDIRTQSDVERFARTSGPNVLIHSAGMIHPRWYREFGEINTVGTKTLLDVFETNGMCGRAVVVSSNSPIGVSRDPSVVFTEDSPFNPYMGYGRSKVPMEQSIAERNRRGGLDTVVIRPPWFYGTHQPPRQAEFFRLIRDGKVPIVGTGENRRSMAYLDNIYDGLVLTLTVAAASRETFWIADTRPYTMNEVMDTIESLLEHEFDTPCAHKRMRLPDTVGEIATAMDAAIQGLGAYHQKIHVLGEMNKTIACSVDKARRMLGYEPKVELREGMRRSLRWQFDHRGGI